MPKTRKMTLSYEDIENLRAIILSKAKTKTKAAEVINADRAHVNRLIKRVNETIGVEGLEWGTSKRLVCPPQAMRLANQVLTLIDESVSYPRVSVGGMASILFEKMLSRKSLGENTGSRATSIRSKDINHELRTFKIDLAIIHESTVSASTDLSVSQLIPWQAVLVMPTKFYSGVENRKLSTIKWDEYSFGYSLYNRVMEFNPGFLNSYVDVNNVKNCASFLEALELVRCGLLYSVLIPDIYLSERDKADLKVIYPPVAVRENLVALFRREDEIKLAPFIDKMSWEAL
jgi:hypothetical protein